MILSIRSLIAIPRAISCVFCCCHVVHVLMLSQWRSLFYIQYTGLHSVAAGTYQFVWILPSCGAKKLVFLSIDRGNFFLRGWFADEYQSPPISCNTVAESDLLSVCSFAHRMMRSNAKPRSKKRNQNEKKKHLDWCDVSHRQVAVIVAAQEMLFIAIWSAWVYENLWKYTRVALFTV